MERLFYELIQVSTGQLVMAWNEADVRLHDQIGMGKNPFKNKVLRKWFEKNHRAMFMKGGELTRPSVSMMLVYLLVTLYWRFIDEGITLRELMDCFYALKRVAGHKKASVIHYEKVLKRLGMLHFSQGVMWVMQEVFRLEEKALVVHPSESRGSFILQEVMSGKRNVLHLLQKYPIDLCFTLL